MIRKTLLTVLLPVFLLAPNMAWTSSQDGDGNISDPQAASPASPSALGDVINSFPNPSVLKGLTFRGDNLWGVTCFGPQCTGPGVLYKMNPDTGAVLSTLSITPAPSTTYGLGYDSARDLFLVANSGADELMMVNPTTGAVSASFTTPGIGPVGAAYDSNRDGYWITDWDSDTIDLVNPLTGALIRFCPAPASASRLAGTGYDSIQDRLLVNSRDDAKTYLLNAATCAEIGNFGTPPGPGLNNGQGAAIRPSNRTAYLTSSEAATIYVVDLGGVAPPILELTLNKTSYAVADDVIATQFDLKNPGPALAAVELKVWLVLPSIPPISILNIGADGSFVLPAGLNAALGPIPLFTVPPGFLSGLCEWNSRMVDPVTGKFISEDINPFTLP